MHGGISGEGLGVLDYFHRS